MYFLNRLVTSVFDGVLKPFSGMSPWVPMTLISLATGLILLLIFKWTSNQGGMKRAKDRIKAHFLEVLLYRDDFRVLLGTQKGLLAQNLRYTAYALVPALVMIPPTILILAQLELRYGHRPIRPGERVIATMELADRVPGEEVEVSLAAPPGITVETPALSVRDEMTAYWRIRAEREGRYDLVFRVGDEEIHKQVLVRGKPIEAERFEYGFGTGGGKTGGGGPAEPGGTAGGVWKAARAATQPSFTEALLYPGERPLPRGSVVKRIEVEYPSYRFGVGRHGFHWLVVFCVISLAFGFSLKPVLRVE